MDKPISPCGVICADCALFPGKCRGCDAVEGKAWWTEFAGLSQCAVYACCHENGRKTCAGCDFLPCERFTKDPTISDEENERHLQAMLANLNRF